MIQDVTIGKLLLYEHAYARLITHLLRQMYEVFTYVKG